MNRFLYTFLGFIIGFFGFQYHFNVDVLEEKTLTQVEFSYLEGCVQGVNYEDCKKMAKIHKNNIESIFKATVWMK